jgi:hypothetical protein
LRDTELGRGYGKRKVVMFEGLHVEMLKGKRLRSSDRVGIVGKAQREKNI